MNSHFGPRCAACGPHLGRPNSTHTPSVRDGRVPAAGMALEQAGVRDGGARGAELGARHQPQRRPRVCVRAEAAVCA
eukprot:4948469-Prymnesium_polylepis.1